MCLRDVAGAADNRRASSTLEETSFGRVGRRERLVLPQQFQDQSRKFAIGIGAKRRHRVGLRYRDLSLVRHLTHLRQAHGVRERLQLTQDPARVGPRQRPHFEAEPSRHRHDVGRRPTLDPRDLQRGVWRVEPLVGFGLEPRFDPLEFPDQPPRIGDRINTKLRHARVRRAALDLHVPAHRPLVGVDHHHRRRLAHDHHARLGKPRTKLGNHRPHADTPDLFVVGQRQMDGSLELARREVGNHRQHAGEEALHIGRAATSDPVAEVGQPERIGRPRLTVDRNDIGMRR